MVAGLTAILMLASVSLTAQSMRQLDVQGPFVEPVSRMAFPERVLGWARTKVVQLPEPGGFMVEYELREQDALLAALFRAGGEMVEGSPLSPNQAATTRMRAVFRERGFFRITISTS